MRALFGQRAADVGWRIVKSVAFHAVTTIATAVASVTVVLCASGVFDPLATMCIFLVFIACFGFCCANLLSVELLQRLSRKFDLYFIIAHAACVAIGGYTLFDSAPVGAVWFALYMFTSKKA
jgi:hypothetical protein